jgi:1-deoxy-D-xylulose-5-phosphate synthase
VQGGFGSAVLEMLSEHHILPALVTRIGLPDMFIEHGSQSILRTKYGLDVDGIVRAAQQMLSLSQPAKALLNSYM